VIPDYTEASAPPSCGMPSQLRRKKGGCGDARSVEGNQLLGLSPQVEELTPTEDRVAQILDFV
jgi:hypothetical protein